MMEIRTMVMDVVQFVELRLFLIASSLLQDVLIVLKKASDFICFFIHY